MAYTPSGRRPLYPEAARQHRARAAVRQRAGGWCRRKAVSRCAGWRSCLWRGSASPVRGAGGGTGSARQTAAGAARLAEVRGDRRQRHRRPRAQYDVGEQHGHRASAVSVRAGDHARRQHLRPPAAAGLRHEIRAAVRGAAVGRRRASTPSLGNHDNPRNTPVRGFHMGGERYYTYAKKNVRFFVLDSNQMDPKQLAWIDDALEAVAGRLEDLLLPSPALFRRRPPRVGRSAPSRARAAAGQVRRQRRLLRDTTTSTNGSQPQKGIAYFVSGSAGELARGDVKPSATTAAYFDQDQSFMLVEIAGDELFLRGACRAPARPSTPASSAGSATRTTDGL